MLFSPAVVVAIPPLACILAVLSIAVYFYQVILRNAWMQARGVKWITRKLAKKLF